MNKRVLVTGANGQLGKTIQKLYEVNDEGIDFFFVTKLELDITNEQKLKQYFKTNKVDYCINCAAYTNVEQAEKTPKKAFKVNAEGVKILAETCKETNTILIHISTDYVFDGSKKLPYTEEDIPCPINQYGKSKLAGEKYIQNTLNKYFIIRTSWLYSEFGQNFYKTILKKSETEKQLAIITSEIGTPTNATDLGKFIFDLIYKNVSKYGVFNYSNLGETTWYGFAEEILKISDKLNRLTLKKTDNYVTFTTRPKYSVLDKRKSLALFEDFEILEWKKSLNKFFLLNKRKYES